MLYARLLGSAWPLAAEPIRVAHAPGATIRAHGRLRVERGRGLVARFLIWSMRLPREDTAAEVRLVVTPRNGGEHWQRTFGDRRFDTRQYETCDGELAERVGIVEFRFRLEVAKGVLFFRQVDAALRLGFLRLRLPAALRPEVEAREEPAGGRQIRIHVRIGLGLMGPLLTYEGPIDIEEPRA